jgi:hypothetical protein
VVLDLIGRINSLFELIETSWIDFATGITLILVWIFFSPSCRSH